MIEKITQAYNNFGAGHFRTDFKFIVHGDIKNDSCFFLSALVLEIKKNTFQKMILYWN